MSAVFNATMLHMFSHIKDMGLDAAMVLSVTALFAATGKPIIGWLSDYAGSKVTIWLALISQVIGLFLLSQANDFSVALLAASLYGFGYSGMSPLRTFSLSTSLGSNTYATASGVLKYIEAPIVLAASPTAGYIKDVTGSYQLAFLVLAGMMFLACLGPFFIKAGGALSRRKAATSAR
jgi:MFS family permease